MSVDITAENALAGTYTLDQMNPSPLSGDLSVAGFARSISKNIGETIEFSVNGPATTIRIFRMGYYGGVNFREVAQIVNTPVTQPVMPEIVGSYGGTSARNWSVTASWDIPETAVSGIYYAMIRNAANNNAFYAGPFVVRDDDAEADIIYKTSDTTWGAAYNHFGTIANPNGKNVYGSGSGVGNIMDRCVAVSYHRPNITRGGVTQTYIMACELPLIAFLERNGHKVKYISSVDLDQVGVPLLQKASIFISSGHDEYWTQPMWDAVETWRDDHAGRSIFMSGNEVFWRSRFQYIGDEVILWCYKDTMPGPSSAPARNPGEPFDPVTWTGTFMDTRWPAHRDGGFLTGTKFGMNGVYDYDIIIPQNPYGGLKVWGGSALVDGQITLTRVLGFEADHLFPTQPNESVRVLAAYTRAAPGGLSDANGQNYNVPGNIEWGIIAQRYTGGGLTVGFGTCQWAWALNQAHDRGNGTEVSVAAQQFTINLLNDLGAAPQTIMPGVSLRPKNSLNEYGYVPGGTAENSSKWHLLHDAPVFPFVKRNGELVRLY